MRQPICVVGFSDMAETSTGQRRHVHVYGFDAHQMMSLAAFQLYAFRRHYKGNLIIFMQSLHSRHVTQNLDHNDILHIITGIRCCNSPLDNTFLGPRQKEGKRIN